MKAEEPALVRSCLVVGEQLIGASADVGIGPITWRTPPMDTRKGLDMDVTPGGERLAKSPKYAKFIENSRR